MFGSVSGFYPVRHICNGFWTAHDAVGRPKKSAKSHRFWREWTAHYRKIDRLGGLPAKTPAAVKWNRKTGIFRS
jgi:hypothetical protein